MNIHTARRKRRRAKQAMKNPKAVRKHTKLGGRTGAVFAKRVHGGSATMISAWPNPPDPVGLNLP